MKDETELQTGIRGRVTRLFSKETIDRILADERVRQAVDTARDFAEVAEREARSAATELRFVAETISEALKTANAEDDLRPLKEALRARVEQRLSK
jgi:hypothetical protein